MNAPGNHRGAAQPALAATQQLFEMQAVALRELQELNMATARAAIEALTAWQSLAGAWSAPSASVRASTDWQQALADYPRRAAEICTRASEGWLAACAEGSRACTEATRAAVEAAARLGPR
jgi:hypothetical protein